MKTAVLKGSRLSPDVLTAWTQLQQSNPSLMSPYFSVDFTRIVAAARNDVEVGIMEDEGTTVAIFPFERRRCNLSGPVGSFISDYHGVISRPDAAFDPRELLRSCGLVAWDFTNVPEAQMPFAPFHRRQHISPIINLCAGYEAYIAERRNAGTEQIKKIGNLTRRLEREIGPLRFVAHSTDKALLDQLLAWKIAHFRRNGWRDIFSIPWVRQTIEEIHAAQALDFAGTLSLLYAGEKMVAAHFGMRSKTIWHYWFPAYDFAFSKYSPGLILLLKMAEHSAALGIKRIDLGSGEHPYKSRLMNGSVGMATGSVELTCFTTLARRICRLPINARRFIGRTPVGALARRIRDRNKILNENKSKPKR